jgi:acyl carrier protein
MNRKEYLDFINDVLVTENAKAIAEDNLLTDSELDSFGYAVLFITLEADLNLNCFEKEYLNSIDYKTYTMKDLLDRIENVY